MMPQDMAIRLMIIGAFQPCQIARLYSGSVPTTGKAAAARSGPTVYPKSSDLESEIEVIEALAASPRLMADNANLR